MAKLQSTDFAFPYHGKLSVQEGLTKVEYITSLLCTNRIDEICRLKGDDIMIGLRRMVWLSEQILEAVDEMTKAKPPVG